MKMYLLMMIAAVVISSTGAVAQTSRLERIKQTGTVTIGYRETVGFCSGTTQVYKPLSAKSLLELPLHAMDTALFYRAYLGLSHHGAIKRLARMLEHVGLAVDDERRHGR